MRRILCLLLAAAVLLGTTACTAKTPEESLTPVSAETAVPEETTQPDEENEKFSRGEWDGLTYTNTFAGFKAVSYTHLDVYKRQTPGRSGAAKGNLRRRKAPPRRGASIPPRG